MEIYQFFSFQLEEENVFENEDQGGNVFILQVPPVVLRRVLPEVA